MSTTSPQSPSLTAEADATRALLADLYAPVAEELGQVEQMLRDELRSQYPAVDELVQYGCLLGGKRLRPALLLLTAKACGELGPSHLVLATVVEMIHTATLVHDDVLDNADVRRHLATVNSRWDNEASVLLGDYLFTHAFYLASTLDTALACRWIGRATNIVCEGELRQKASRGDFGLAESEYLSIIEAKTAELCACSCQLGAHFAGASAEVVEALEGFGRDLGIAFQIADDLLDLVGAEDEVGKSLGTDFAQRILTSPLIHCLRSLPEERRTAAIELLQSEDCDRARFLKLLESTDSLAYARQSAHRRATDALRRLEVLPASPAADTLRRIAAFVVQRSR